MSSFHKRVSCHPPRSHEVLDLPKGCKPTYVFWDSTDLFVKSRANINVDILVVGLDFYLFIFVILDHFDFFTRYNEVKVTLFGRTGQSFNRTTFDIDQTRTFVGS